MCLCVCVFKCHFDPYIVDFTCVFLTFVQVSMDNGFCACLFMVHTKGVKQLPFVPEICELRGAIVATTNDYIFLCLLLFDFMCSLSLCNCMTFVGGG